jgi:hypothetical protein
MPRRSVYAGVNIRTPLAVLVLLAAAGCQGNGPILRPTPPADPGAPVSVTPAPAAIVAVRVEGSVVNADNEMPVAGVSVTATHTCKLGPCQLAPILPAPNAATDARGVFVLTANVPADWELLFLNLTRDGYESSGGRTSPAATIGTVLILLPTLTIRAGESLDTRVFNGPRACGSESWPCRQVIIDSPSGAPMELEFIPLDGQRGGGLIVGPEATHPFSPAPQQRVTVAGGEVWIYGSVGRVRLTARSR